MRAWLIMGGCYAAVLVGPHGSPWTRLAIAVTVTVALGSLLVTHAHPNRGRDGR